MVAKKQVKIVKYIMAGVEELKAAKDLEDLGSFRGLVVAHFWTPWSEPCKQMNEAMEDLAKEYERVKFFKVKIGVYPLNILD